MILHVQLHCESTAGWGRGMKIWKAMARYPVSQNIEYQVTFTEGSGDARRKEAGLTEGAEASGYIITAGVHSQRGENDGVNALERSTIIDI